MTVTRTRALVGIVVTLALVQVLFEDLVLFLGVTGEGSPGVLSSPYVLVAVPLLISLLLLGVLVGGAIWHADTLR